MVAENKKNNGDTAAYYLKKKWLFNEMNNEIKKRKVLFITPDYMDYTAIIRSGINEYLNAETYLITTSGKELRLTYRNSAHRIQNFFSKLFLNKNLKKNIL